MKTIMILYCIFSIIILAAFIAVAFEEENKSMGIFHYLAAFSGPILFPMLLGFVLYRIIYSDKL